MDRKKKKPWAFHLSTCLFRPSLALFAISLFPDTPLPVFYYSNCCCTSASAVVIVSNAFCHNLSRQFDVWPRNKQKKYYYFNNNKKKKIEKKEYYEQFVHKLTQLFVCLCTWLFLALLLWIEIAIPDWQAWHEKRANSRMIFAKNTSISCKYFDENENSKKKNTHKRGWGGWHYQYHGTPPTNTSKIYALYMHFYF